LFCSEKEIQGKTKSHSRAHTRKTQTSFHLPHTFLIITFLERKRRKEEEGRDRGKEGRKEGRRKEGRKEGRKKEGRKRKRGRKEGREREGGKRGKTILMCTKLVYNYITLKLQ
jgi:hypothetical protein